MSAGGVCWNCGRALGAGDYGRGESCPACDADARCCRNCGHHSPSVNNECRETQADRVVEKARANFCEFFQPTAKLRKAGQTRPPARAPRSSAKSAFESLFKNNPPNKL